MSTLIGFELPLGVTKLGIDFLQTRVDEGLRTHGNLVLVFVGLAVVADDELLQVIDSTLRNLIVQHQLCDSGRLRRLTNRQRACILIGCYFW